MTSTRKWTLDAKDEGGNDISARVSAEVEALIEVTRFDHIAPGRVSILFLLTLFGAFKAGAINPFRVAQEIQALESGKPTGMKSPGQFKHPPLRGLWHQHYMQGGMSELAMNVKRGLKEFGIPYLQQKVNEAEEAGELRYFSVEDVAPLTRDAVEGNLQRLREAVNLTGEWIIFAKHAGQNYYLSLATHHKSTHEDLRQQIDALCCREFPFLAELLACQSPALC
jgi:hypothetical protein